MKNLHGMGKVLITGASGLLGTRLTELLLGRGYRINVISRFKSSSSAANYQSFCWNIEKGEIDSGAFEGVSAVVHLAGAGVAESRWSDKRKKEIMDSRVKSAKLIFDFIKSGNHEVKTFMSAGGVGYYGDCGDEPVSEDRKPGRGFLAEVCKRWEASALKFCQLDIRAVRCRIGIVLSKNGGALPELARTLPLGIAPYFSGQNLFYSWIHIDDVCGIMIHALENENINGAFNLTAPQPLLMKDLMREILQAKGSRALLVPVPPVAIKLAMGEMSEMLLFGQRCSAEKIRNAGYKFKYGEIKEALKNICG